MHIAIRGYWEGTSPTYRILCPRNCFHFRHDFAPLGELYFMCTGRKSANLLINIIGC